MRRILVAAVSTVLFITGLLATPVLAATSTWHIQVGSVLNFPDGRFGNAFYPARIAAHAGDKVAFTLTSPHTVTFNRPDNAPLPALFPPSSGTALTAKGQFVNSGFNPATFVPGTVFALTLGNALPPGRYQFICALHLGMRGAIDVVPAAAELPKTNADYAAEASRQIARDLAAVNHVADKIGDKAARDSLTVFVGAGTKRVTNLRFFPSSITVKVGQSVTFLKTHDPTEPHTVTFGMTPTTPPFNEFAPSGGPPFVFTGSNLISTGAMLTEKQYDFYIAGALGVPAAVDRTTVKFTAPGKYTYVCLIHDDVGMKATVNVEP
jgi:plastocyanin